MTVTEARRRALSVLAVLLLLDAAALIVLLTPLGRASATTRDNTNQVRTQLRDEMRRALPLRNIDQKLAASKQQIEQFTRERLPQRESAIPEELGRVAQQNGVRFSNIRYNPDDAPVAGLRRLEIDASLAGDYLKVVKFINALERDKMFFIVDSINLAEQQGGNVRLELKLETYLRAAGAS
jgi:type IV pilus assembly protein PilO